MTSSPLQNEQWFLALSLAAEYLPRTFVRRLDLGPDDGSPELETWCSWTTFDRLHMDAGYWKAPIPKEWEILDTSVSDGGTWGQPFSYSELAHLIIPRTFLDEPQDSPIYRAWTIEQDVEGLSTLYSANQIPHVLGQHALEIKLY